MKKLFLPMLLAVCVFTARGQGEVPVNFYTGTPNIEIPIVNLVSHDLSDAVSLVYDSRGVRPKDTGGDFGLSWNLNYGGSITREVRGLPDDFIGTGSDLRRGWFSTGAGSPTYINADVAAMSNTSDLSASTCSDETDDFNRINGYGYNNDTEPDIFRYTIGNLSGSFVFDNTGGKPTIRLIPYQDITITPRFDNGRITVFTITDNKGVSHTFGQPLYIDRYTESSNLESTVEFLKTNYELYAKSTHANAVVSYIGTWYLSNTKSPSGDEISYGYADVTVPAQDPDIIHVSLWDNGSAQDVYNTFELYKDYRISTTLRRPYTITTKAGPRVSFKVTDGLITTIYITDKRGGANNATLDTLKQFDLLYNVLPRGPMLYTIQEHSGNVQYPPYKFQYNGSSPSNEDFWGYGKFGPGGTIPKMYVYPDLAPSEHFRIEPIPGYTGRVFTLPGADRTVDPNAITGGALRSIDYPWGGRTSLVFESNQYYDSIAGANQYGGGIRIQSVSYNDGLDPDKNISKTFVYTDSTGRSTGRLVYKPQFAIESWKYKDPESSAENSTANGNGDWMYFTVRTDHNLAPEELTQGSPVGYKEVKVYRPGSGYARYEYDIRAPYGITTALPYEATQNKFARSTSCIDMRNGTNAAGYNTFPYAPNPIFDYERGLVKRKRDYDEQGNLIQEERHRYQYVFKSGSTAVKVWGLRFEKYPNTDENVFFFAKYGLLTDVAKVPAKDIFTTYAGSGSTTRSVEYFYESPFHKLLNRTKTTTPENVVYQTYSQYPLDYGIIPAGADKPSMLIDTLQNGRNGVVIESYQTITRPGAAELITAGTVQQFDDFGTAGKVLLQNAYAWSASVPKALSIFKKSYIDVATKKFTIDSNYKITTTVLAYDAYAKPRAVQGRDRQKTAIVWGYGTSVPTVTVKNADLGTFTFSDFETTTSASFDQACTFCDPFSPLSIPTTNSGKLAANPFETSLSKTMTKGNGDYRFSGWWNRHGKYMTVIVNIKSTDKGTTYYTITFDVLQGADTTGYQYFEKSIPMSNVPSSFYIEVFFVPDIPNPFIRQPEIDNVWFGPLQSTYTYNTYTFPYGVQSTGSNHILQSIVYDGLGRVKYVRDKDKNILQRKAYQFNNN